MLLLAEQAARLAEQARFPEMNPGPVVRLGFDAHGGARQRGRAGPLFGEGVAGRYWPDLCPTVSGPFSGQEVVDTDGVFPLEARVAGRGFRLRAPARPAQPVGVRVRCRCHRAEAGGTGVAAVRTDGDAGNARGRGRSRAE